MAPLKATDSGAATFLGLASDGREYWIKAQNNPQGSRSLIPERVVTHLGQKIGAPVRPIALVQIPGELDWTFAPGLRLRPGTAHGSLNLDSAKIVDDWRGLARRDDNRRRIAFLAALWDLCLGNDPQWLVEFADDAALWSFDHGFWFAGEVDWSPTTMTSGAWTSDGVGDSTATELRAAAAAVEELIWDDFEAAVHDVPLEWGTTQAEMSEVARILYARVGGVARRLREASESAPVR